METMTEEFVEVSTDDVDAPASSDVDALQDQRLRFDGYFTGPTW